MYKYTCIHANTYTHSLTHTYTHKHTQTHTNTHTHTQTEKESIVGNCDNCVFFNFVIIVFFFSKKKTEKESIVEILASQIEVLVFSFCDNCLFVIM